MVDGVDGVDRGGSGWMGGGWEVDGRWMGGGWEVDGRWMEGG